MGEGGKGGREGGSGGEGGREGGGRENTLSISCKQVTEYGDSQDMMLTIYSSFHVLPLSDGTCLNSLRKCFSHRAPQSSCKCYG